MLTGHSGTNSCLLLSRRTTCSYITSLNTCTWSGDTMQDTSMSGRSSSMLTRSVFLYCSARARGLDPSGPGSVQLTSHMMMMMIMRKILLMMM